MTALKAVLYARVSSEKQAEKDLSISAQLKAMRKHADGKGYQVVREFVDEAESARTANRPQFQEMIALAKRKPKAFDVILVWKLSRFARSRQDSVVYKSLLRKAGVQVVSINEPVDDTPAGQMFEAIIEAMDEFYSANLSQEARRGLKEVASRGFYPGGSTPIGYKLVEAQDGRATRKTLVVDEEHAETVRQIFSHCIQGHGAKEIAQTLNESGVRTKRGGKWSKPSVLYLLKNQVYTGDLVWPQTSRLKQGEEQIIIENHHESLVARRDFELVQTLISGRAPAIQHPQRVSSNYVLSGLLYCKECGKAMQGGTAKSGQYRYYNCYSKLRVGNSVCQCRPINNDRLESAVIGRLQEHVLTEKNLSDLLELTNAEILAQSGSVDREIESVTKQLAKTEGRLHKLYDVLETGTLTAEDLAPRIRALKDEAEDLRTRLIRLEFDRQSPSQNLSLSMAELKPYVEDLRSILLEEEFSSRRRFFAHS